MTVVPCPGTEVDSSDAIQAALEGAAPGTTVQLQAGTYYLSKAIWVDTAFQGTLRGAGKNRTTITTLPGVAISAIPIVGYGYDTTTLLYFQVPPGQVGDITVSDMTIEVTGPAAFIESMVFAFAECADTTFARLRFAGAWGEQYPGSGISAFCGLAVCGYWPESMTGNHTLEACEFVDLRFPYAPQLFRDARVRIVGNCFTGGDYGPYLLDFSHCTTVCSGNAIRTAWCGFSLTNGGWGQPEKPSTFVIRDNSVTIDVPVIPAFAPPGGAAIWIGNGTDEGNLTCIVKHNDIRVSGHADGIRTANWAPTLSPNMRVVSNTFTMDVSSNPDDAAAVYGGIGTYGVQNAYIANNRILGKAMAGIYLGVFGDAVSGWMIKGNNVNGLATEVAPIWLGPGTSTCTVIGVNAKDNVLDEGTDNVVTGMKWTRGHALGPRIHDAQERMLEMREHLRVWK